MLCDLCAPAHVSPYGRRFRRIPPAPNWSVSHGATEWERGLTATEGSDGTFRRFRVRAFDDRRSAGRASDPIRADAAYSAQSVARGAQFSRYRCRRGSIGLARSQQSRARACVSYAHKSHRVRVAGTGTKRHTANKLFACAHVRVCAYVQVCRYAEISSAIRCFTRFSRTAFEMSRIYLRAHFDVAGPGCCFYSAHSGALISRPDLCVSLAPSLALCRCSRSIVPFFFCCGGYVRVCVCVCVPFLGRVRRTSAMVGGLSYSVCITTEHGTCINYQPVAYA